MTITSQPGPSSPPQPPALGSSSGRLSETTPLLAPARGTDHSPFSRRSLAHWTNNIRDLKFPPGHQAAADLVGLVRVVLCVQRQLRADRRVQAPGRGAVRALVAENDQVDPQKLLPVLLWPLVPDPQHGLHRRERHQSARPPAPDPHRALHRHRDALVRQLLLPLLREDRLRAAQEEAQTQGRLVPAVSGRLRRGRRVFQKTPAAAPGPGASSHRGQRRVRVDRRHALAAAAGDREACHSRLHRQKHRPRPRQLDAQGGARGRPRAAPARGHRQRALAAVETPERVAVVPLWVAVSADVHHRPAVLRADQKPLSAAAHLESVVGGHKRPAARDAEPRPGLQGAHVPQTAGRAEGTGLERGADAAGAWPEPAGPGAQAAHAGRGLRDRGALHQPDPDDSERDGVLDRRQLCSRRQGPAEQLELVSLRQDRRVQVGGGQHQHPGPGHPARERWDENGDCGAAAAGDLAAARFYMLLTNFFSRIFIYQKRCTKVSQQWQKTDTADRAFEAARSRLCSTEHPFLRQRPAGE
ncbi:hypothetical protein KL933_001058 [Ogataea haglerorum]|uniref:Uncharacterized protein n=1 Tax=Ogataea haglerorum TaxID=1937702 RepID=A0AAN6DAI0_9ASCO|nr:hypothetical protein KL950_001552 [Ogataea haglerorum]KAG7729978.1 hypothetical protein KL933_001058 [Ogataea haglerorum]KAG7732595.1 hypothetical protein KL948_002025 [Ogataea haglerorum]KAG7740210.1 hypothetical protein KL923_002051 [Ogataea haglerorum]KAG7767341.1 hypothetical protein KL946_001440 [Ogataea haglerorum]